MLKQKNYYRQRFQFNDNKVSVDLRKLKQFMNGNQQKVPTVIFGVEKFQIEFFQSVKGVAASPFQHVYTMTRAEIKLDIPNNDRSFTPNRMQVGFNEMGENNLLFQLKNKYDLMPEHYPPTTNDVFYTTHKVFNWRKDLEMECLYRDMQDTDILENQNTSNMQQEEEEELKLYDDEIVLNIGDKTALSLQWDFDIKARSVIDTTKVMENPKTIVTYTPVLNSADFEAKYKTLITSEATSLIIIPTIQKNEEKRMSENQKVDTQEIKLEAWMQFLIIIITLGLQMYYQKEKFTKTTEEFNLLKKFSQAITQHKIEKTLQKMGANAVIQIDKAALGQSLSEDLKLLNLVKCNSQIQNQNDAAEQQKIKSD